MVYVRKGEKLLPQVTSSAVAVRGYFEVGDRRRAKNI